MSHRCNGTLGLLPPPWYLASMAELLVGYAIAGGIVGLSVGSLLLHVGNLAGFEPVLCTMFGAALGCTAFGVRLGDIESRLNDGWKRDTAVRLRMTEVSLERFRHVICLDERRCPEGEDIGLLEETSASLVFHGPKGDVSIPFASIRTASRDGFMGYWWLRLGLADGSVRWLVVKEGSTAWGGCAATAALAIRIRGRWLELMVPPHQEKLNGCADDGALH